MHDGTTGSSTRTHSRGKYKVWWGLLDLASFRICQSDQESREELEAEGRALVKVCVCHSRARAGRCRVHAWVEGRGTSVTSWRGWKARLRSPAEEEGHGEAQRARVSPGFAGG